MTRTVRDHDPWQPLRRVGYAAAVVVNAVLLWISHQLLDWQWPGFLTQDFERVLGVVSASFVASIIVNAALVVVPHARLKAFGDLVTGVFGVAVGWRTWTVFPFDFTGYDTDWTWLARTLLVLVIAGTAIGIVVSLVKVLAGPPDDRLRGAVPTT